VDQTEYVALLARAQQAPTIVELRTLATEVRAAHPNDPDAERIADVCQMYALDMIARLGERRRRRPGGDAGPRDYTERAYR
jgi:hypothetical protein